jgi:hypothetical protein
VNGRIHRRSLERWAPWLVVLLGSPVVTPLLRWSAEPCTHDGHLHYHRIAAMAHAWHSGLYLSRWLPDVAFGFGYPFFVFREALPLYLSLIPHLLGLPLPAAMNLFYALCILGGGVFMYLWVRDIFGPASGIVSAVAYMAAPYVLVDALVRGNNPESLALALLPFLAWAGRRFILRGDRVHFLAASLGLAVLALSHNISVLIFSAVYPVYLLGAGWLARLPRRALIQRTALIVALGLAAGAFYTLPALAELDQITISQSVTTRNNDFRFNFTTLAEILAPVNPEDPGLLNPPLLLRLGWAPAFLAILGLAGAAVLSSRQARGHIVMMVAAAAIFLFASSEASSILWERLPLVAYIQFPWRLVGRAALPVAFLAGVPVAAAGQILASRFRHASTLVGGLFAGALLLEAMPGLYPAYCPSPAYPTISQVHDYERATGMVGVDPEGSYFPKTVQERPKGSPLEADYRAGRMPQRFDLAVLPEATALVSADYRPTSARIVVEGSEPFQARYLSFDYPGWTVTIDGQRVEAWPSDAEGLLTFDVPGGRQEIHVRWARTPLRAWAAVFSGLALLAVVAVILSPGLRLSQTVGQESASAADQSPLPLISLLVFVFVALAILGGKLLIVDHLETPWRRPLGPSVSYPVRLEAAELGLEGFNLNRATVAAGESFDIDLAWRVLRAPRADYQSNVWLQGPEGLIWSDKETHRPRTHEDTAPTRAWLPGQWAWDSREVQIVAGTPPGTYDIVLTLFDLADLQPRTLVDPSGTVVGPTAVIGQMEVSRPGAPAVLAPQVTLVRSLGGLRLLGYSQDRPAAAPGEQMLLTLFWEMPDEPGPVESQLSLTLLDAAGSPGARWSLPPVRDDYPPAQWQAGERLRGQHALRLPAALPSGRYRFVLDGTAMGQLDVIAPEREFSSPELAKAVAADFEGQAMVVGFSLSPTVPEPGAEVTVTLVWRALAEMEHGYRVFVHLLDGGGAIAAQSDGEPADWTRPTTGWLPGEYIVDRHTLYWPADLSLEAAAIRTGLYDPHSGQRLNVGAADSVLLPHLPDR